ncbi:TolC family outer membrane protein [Acuticoccus mangrovi]|uniref:TolC family outer membrane protein n=1 Tax=Acuticoccus mangrovi TaxID=2796142 RepID=A0A934MC12_9HYPH|nr:TolC family outer membrane protein [Acuticoccus mangrovi]
MKVQPFGIAALASVALLAATPTAFSQTLTQSLAAAYTTNPQLNVARSSLRSIDENIAIARSGNRPTLSAAFSQSTQTTRILGNRSVRGTQGTNPTAISLTLTQPLFQGFQVRNTIRQAESAVQAQRAALENTEQSVLLDVATAFQDVIQNRSIVQLRQSDVRFLSEQVRAAQDRFDVGEGTRTDVSQAEARRAEAQSALNFAEANLAASEATYRQLTGLNAGNLHNNFNVERLLPKSVDASVKIGQQAHPAITASLHDVDTAMFNVKALEGQFLPTVNVVGEAGTTWNQSNSIDRQDSAALGLNVSIPIYQGGRVSAQVRQAKEDLGTSRIQVDLTRDQVRQNTVASWAAYQASVRSIFAARTGVFAAQLALDGVVEEQRVGQRTTLDVLDAQRDLVSAQVTLVESERDKEVAAFTLLSAVGRLTARQLGLQVAIYQPEQHTNAVRDKWFGLRTPDGR